MDRKQQQTIDFTRSQQRAMIKRLDLPKLEKLTPESDRSIRASNTVCKSVLKAIDDYGRGGLAWPSQSTLALDTDLSKRQVATAIARLKHYGLLAIDKRKLPSGMVGNVYSVVWSELAVMQQKRDAFKLGRDAVTAPGTPERDAVRAERDAVRAERDAVRAERDAVRAERDAVTAHKPTRNDKEPTTNPPGLVAGEIENLLRRCGARRFRSLAEEFRDRVDDVRQAVAVWEANQSRIGPGAVIAFLRDGCWPCDDLVDPAKAAAAQVAAAARRLGVDREREEYLAYCQARQLARHRDWSPEQVDDWVAERLRQTEGRSQL